MSRTHASPSRPCPLCGRKKSCAWTSDGLHFCLSRHRGEIVPDWVHLGESKDGTWGMWRAEGDDRRRDPSSRRAPKGTTPAKPAKVEKPAVPPPWVRAGGWDAYRAGFAEAADQAIELTRWAAALGVSVASLEALEAVH